MVVPTMKSPLPLVVQKELSLNDKAYWVRRQNQLAYILNRKIDGSALAKPRALASGPIHQFFNNLLEDFKRGLNERKINLA